MTRGVLEFKCDKGASHTTARDSTGSRPPDVERASEPAAFRIRYLFSRQS
jgi:hypothetical protein